MHLVLVISNINFWKLCTTFWIKIHKLSMTHSGICLNSNFLLHITLESVNCFLVEEIVPSSCRDCTKSWDSLNCMQQMFNVSKERQYNQIRITPSISNSQKPLDGYLLQPISQGSSLGGHDLSGFFNNAPFNGKWNIRLDVRMNMNSYISHFQTTFVALGR